MKFEKCIKTACGRCETPANTIRRLEAAIGARYDFWMWEEEVAEHLHWSAMFVDELSFRSMGKGVTRLLSRAGALAEGAEYLAARDFRRLPGSVIAGPEEVPDPVRIEELLPHIRTATPGVIARIAALDEARHWVDGYSLLRGRKRSVPIDYVRVINGPNGRAAGNRVEEAVAHALNEVFERRAQLAVLRNRMVMPTIDERTIRNDTVLEQLAFVRGKGVEVCLKDLSFGGELPCVGAYFLDPGIPEEYQFHHFFKVGASFAREDALIRAFTEYVQGRKPDEFIDGRAHELERVLAPDFRGLKSAPEDSDNLLSAFLFGFVPWRRADFLRQGELVPFDPGERFEDCREDINRALGIFERLGKDCLIVDLTDPEIGFPVVQAVVPGYSDTLPFHPAWSDALFRAWTREDALRSYGITGSSALR